MVTVINAISRRTRIMNFRLILLIITSSAASLSPASESGSVSRRADLRHATRSAMHSYGNLLTSVRDGKREDIQISNFSLDGDLNSWQDITKPSVPRNGSDRGSSTVESGAGRYFREGRRLRDGGTVKTLDEIYHFLREISAKNEDAVDLLQIGVSYTGVPIYAVKIHREGFPSIATMVVEFGIHAREWASPASAMYLIQQLLRERGHLIEAVLWYIIPVLNPEGYNYSTHSKDNLWRKNLRSVGKKGCPGVDLNRNFGVAWDTWRSQEECDDTYAGHEPFSEPESLAVRDLVESIGAQFIDGYVAVHSCAQSILHPYGHQQNAPDKEKLELLKEAGHKMADKMYQVRGQTYSVKQAASLGVAGGGSDDFMFEYFHVPLVYTLELGDQKAKKPGACFHPNSDLMDSLTKECYAGLTALAEYILHSKRTKIKSRIARPSESIFSAARRISAAPEKLAFLTVPRLLPIY